MRTVQKTRIKKTAIVDVPQTLDACASQLRELGDLSRRLTRSETEMNDAIASITEKYQPVLDGIKQQIKPLQEGIQAFAEANRDALTDHGKSKTINLVTGLVQWRQRPPSVRISGADSVMDMLKRLGMGDYIRVREEVNKEAILNNPEAVRGVAGISVVTGVEDFVITPFEQAAG